MASDLDNKFMGTKTWRMRLRVGSVLAVLLGVGVAYLNHKLGGPALTSFVALPGGVVLAFVLMYVTYAIWKCPACQKHLGQRNDIAICPSCAHDLYGAAEHQSLKERIRDHQARSERPMDKSELVARLETAMLKKKLSRPAFYGFCILLLIAGFSFRDLPGVKPAVIVTWFMSLLGYLLFDFTQCRCPLCHTHLDREDRFCTKCGLGNQ